jgi:hypothetical protein
VLVQGPTDKRVSKPREELLRDLFRLFERQPHWAFAQLQKHTEQPTAHLKASAAQGCAAGDAGPRPASAQLANAVRSCSLGYFGGPMHLLAPLLVQQPLMCDCVPHAW